MTIRSKIRKFLINILEDTSRKGIGIDAPVPSPSSQDTFRGEFTGWNFRLHRATGGMVLEAWRYPGDNNPYPTSLGSKATNKLFIINTNETIEEELPKILTALAMEN